MWENWLVSLLDQAWVSRLDKVLVSWLVLEWDQTWVSWLDKVLVPSLVLEWASWLDQARVTK